MLFFVILAGLLFLNGCGLSCTTSPSISGQPASQTVPVGAPAMFTVAAAGSAPLSYQWMKNGEAIPGATQPTYMTPLISSADSGSTFAITVTNRYGVISSAPATLTVSQTANESRIRFVAPNGNDGNNGSLSSPYRTIQHCAATVAAGWTCAIRRGTYRETVTPNSGITIAAYNLEAVTVDGSDPVSGWKPYKKSIYKTNISLRGDDTNQLFVGDQMMTEARWPNGNDLFHVNWATEHSGTNVSQIIDSHLPNIDWTGAKIHLWSGTDPFGHQTGVVTSSTSGQLSINVYQSATCPVICPVSGGYYYLFGTLGALDVEQEWYYDASSQTLYFMAPGKVNPNTIDVRSKQREYAFDLRGKSGVTIQNISIFASTIVTDETSSNNILDRINAQYVSHFTELPLAPNDQGGGLFSILHVHETDSGIIINGTGNTLQNCTISYSAGSGVALNGTNNMVANNLIKNVDYIGDYSSGIGLNGNSNSVQKNTIQDTGRQAIYINAVINQDIGYNNLFSPMLLTRDGAAIYACCYQTASGTRIHHNWIHDAVPIIGGHGDTNAMAGVYFDNGSAGFTVDQNVLWNNRYGSILINGASSGTSTGSYIGNNTVPDSALEARIKLINLSDCPANVIVDNRVVVRPDGTINEADCVLATNNSAAAGATDMTPASQVGCNFDGCASSPPPAIFSGDSVTPCPFTGTELTGLLARQCRDRFAFFGSTLDEHVIK